MRRNWTETAAALLAAMGVVMVLGGCATSKEKLLPHGDSTMLDVWNQETGGSAGSSAGIGGSGQAARQLLDARQGLRRPQTEGDMRAAPAANAAYTRTAANEIYRQFHRLPNPDLVMFVYPHLAGTDPVPVPGYTTVFPLYQRVRYAMPGERLEDY
jgi:conjugative transfer region lipoprotein (TIGR03751 family)